jgi:hypothetical protein
MLGVRHSLPVRLVLAHEAESGIGVPQSAADREDPEAESCEDVTTPPISRNLRIFDSLHSRPTDETASAF